MSVRKVKISELPQLQPDASGEGIFMPAADENNHSYRVPLSRYDNAKGEAEAAAAAAQSAAKEADAAAEAANAAADRANGVVDGSTAGEALTAANEAKKAASTLAQSLPGTATKVIQGVVKGRPLRYRNTIPNMAFGNIAYPVAGYGYTFDLKAPASGNMQSVLREIAGYGDVTLLFQGRYSYGWLGQATTAYKGALVSVHLTKIDSIDAIVAMAFDYMTFVQWSLIVPLTGAYGDWMQIASAHGPFGPAGGDLAGEYPNPTIKTGAVLDACLTASQGGVVNGTPGLYKRLANRQDVYTTAQAVATGRGGSFYLRASPSTTGWNNIGLDLSDFIGKTPDFYFTTDGNVYSQNITIVHEFPSGGVKKLVVALPDPASMERGAGAGFKSAVFVFDLMLYDWDYDRTLVLCNPADGSISYIHASNDYQFVTGVTDWGNSATFQRYAAFGEEPSTTELNVRLVITKIASLEGTFFFVRSEVMPMESPDRYVGLPDFSDADADTAASSARVLTRTSAISATDGGDGDGSAAAAPKRRWKDRIVYYGQPEPEPESEAAAAETPVSTDNVAVAGGDAETMHAASAAEQAASAEAEQGTAAGEVVV